MHFTPITSNLWILTSTTELDPAGIILICPDKALKSIKLQKPFQILCLPAACSAMFWQFHLPPHYENHQTMINISLNTSNLNMMNISSPGFWVWQHLEDHWNKTQLHKLADIPTVPVAYLCKHMISNNGPILPFYLADKSVDDPSPLWSLLSHTSIYVMAIGSLIHTGIGIFSCYFFCSQPVILASQLFQSGSLQHTFEDDHVEAAAIYRHNGMVGKPVKGLCKNRNLCMKQGPRQTVSWQKQQVPSKRVPESRSLDIKPNFQGIQWAHMVCCKTSYRIP